LQIVESIWRDPAFERRNPNRVSALLHQFAQHNWPQFHARNGGGYAFIAAQVLSLDRQNPQLAARLAQAFDLWRRFDSPRQDMMRMHLECIAAAPELSGDVREVVEKSLGR